MIVEEAAKQLGMSTQTLRLALQQNKFSFGVAIKTSENRWTYYINPLRLRYYLEGKDYDEKMYSTESRVECVTVDPCQLSLL